MPRILEVLFHRGEFSLDKTAVCDGSTSTTSSRVDNPLCNVPTDRQNRKIEGIVHKSIDRRENVRSTPSNSQYQIVPAAAPEQLRHSQPHLALAQLVDPASTAIQTRPLLFHIISQHTIQIEKLGNRALAEMS